jgi:antitoxin YefM
MTRIMVMSEIHSLSFVKAHLSELVDRVEQQQERIQLTRNGRVAAVLIHPDDLEGLEETLTVLSDGRLMAELEEARDAVRSGDSVGLDELKRRLDDRD